MKNPEKMSEYESMWKGWSLRDKNPERMSKRELRLEVMYLRHLIERLELALNSKPIVSREYRARQVLGL